MRERAAWLALALAAAGCGGRGGAAAGGAAADDSGGPGGSDDPGQDADADGYDAAIDCDDADPAVNPGSSEVAYDGIDNDCSPSSPDDDLDADGHLRGPDCDDADAGVNPDSEEICGDYLDNDCDGTPNHCALRGERSLLDADARLVGEASGDTDGDGYRDLLVGASGQGPAARGAVHIVLGVGL